MLGEDRHAARCQVGLIQGEKQGVLSFKVGVVYKEGVLTADASHS